MPDFRADVAEPLPCLQKVVEPKGDYRVFASTRVAKISNWWLFVRGIHVQGQVIAANDLQERHTTMPQLAICFRPVAPILVKTLSIVLGFLLIIGQFDGTAQPRRLIVYSDNYFSGLTTIKFPVEAS